MFNFILLVESFLIKGIVDLFFVFIIGILINIFLLYCFKIVVFFFIVFKLFVNILNEIEVFGIFFIVFLVKVL